MEDYEYPYGEMQVHEALEDLDRRLKALELKSAKTPTQIAQEQAAAGSQDSIFARKA